MRGHFGHLHFETFLMTPRTPQGEVFRALLSSSKHSGVPEDSDSRLFQVLGFTPTLGQRRGATGIRQERIPDFIFVRHVLNVALHYHPVDPDCLDSQQQLVGHHLIRLAEELANQVL
jgi:hypothetical protein